MQGIEYDSAGNTRTDLDHRRFTYDGENKQIKVETTDGSGNVTGTLGEYFYDGDGKRVKEISLENSQWITTIFVYDSSGKMLAEYSTQTSTTPQVSYLTNDHLGSPRANTDATGKVTARHDYQPFGEEVQRASHGTDQVRKKFTSYERDNETDLESYRIIVTNDSGTRRFFDVTRSSTYGAPGKYGKSQEAPPGSFTGKIRTDGNKGFRIELTEPGQKDGQITSPDTDEKRTNIQIHRNGLLVEGCMVFPKEDHKRFTEPVTKMLGEDKNNGLGDNINITVVPRNPRDGNGAGDVNKNDPNISPEDGSGDTDSAGRKTKRQRPAYSPKELQ